MALIGSCKDLGQAFAYGSPNPVLLSWLGVLSRAFDTNGQGDLHGCSGLLYREGQLICLQCAFLFCYLLLTRKRSER